MTSVQASSVSPRPSAEAIRQAAERIRPYIHRTPVMTSENLDRITGTRLFFKCENLQKAGAFKSRGACNAVFSLPANEMVHGVATHSSGNHAQAIARAASLRGIKAHVVMPETAPVIKVEAVKHYGGQITFCRPTLADREETLRKIIDQTGATEIHPYNDLRTIAGQATAALEIIEEIGSPDILMAPVGGGGLLSGSALAASYFSPSTMVFGAEPLMADDACRSFYSRTFIPSENPRTIADGLLTSLGTITFPIILDLVSEILTVSEAAIIQAMHLTWERMKIIIEPSSAVPLAAILEHPQHFFGKSVVIILSGGNTDLKKIPWMI